jgi:hypothetical protein
MDLQLAQELIRVDELEARLGELSAKAMTDAQRRQVFEGRADLIESRMQIHEIAARGTQAKVLG